MAGRFMIGGNGMASGKAKWKFESGRAPDANECFVQANLRKADQKWHSGQSKYFEPIRNFRYRDESSLMSSVRERKLEPQKRNRRSGKPEGLDQESPTRRHWLLSTNI